jgi:hypothetical protein
MKPNGSMPWRLAMAVVILGAFALTAQASARVGDSLAIDIPQSKDTRTLSSQAAATTATTTSTTTTAATATADATTSATSSSGEAGTQQAYTAQQPAGDEGIPIMPYKHIAKSFTSSSIFGGGAAALAALAETTGVPGQAPTPWRAVPPSGGESCSCS